MPLSQCMVAPTTQSGEKVSKTKDRYAYSNKEIVSLEMLVTVIAFIWPLLLLIATYFYSFLNRKVLFKVVELILCCGSAYALVSLVYFGVVLYGGYIAGVSVVLFFLITVYELYNLTLGNYIEKHNKSVK